MADDLIPIHNDEMRHSQYDANQEQTSKSNNANYMVGTPAMNTDQEVFNRLKETAMGGGAGVLRKNHSLVQTNFLTITSNLPTNKFQSTEKPNNPILQKIQGQYIETGGGGIIDFIQEQSQDSESGDKIVHENATESTTTAR